MPSRRHDWGSVDWSQPTRVIAQKLGTSGDIVSQKRRALGLPKPARNRKAKYDWDSVDWSKSCREIAEEIGSTERSVGTTKWKFGFTRRNNIDWGAVDWRKSNRDLARDLQRSEKTVAGQRLLRDPRHGGYTVLQLRLEKGEREDVVRAARAAKLSNTDYLMQCHRSAAQGSEEGSKC